MALGCAQSCAHTPHRTVVRGYEFRRSRVVQIVGNYVWETSATIVPTSNLLIRRAFIIRNQQVSGSIPAGGSTLKSMLYGPA